MGTQSDIKNAQSKSYVMFRVTLPHDETEWEPARCLAIEEVALALEKTRKKYGIDFCYRIEAESPWIGIPIKDIE